MGTRSLSSKLMDRGGLYWLLIKISIVFSQQVKFILANDLVHLNVSLSSNYSF